MKPRQVDLIVVLVGIFLSIVVSLAWNNNHIQCSMHTPNISAEQIKKLPDHFYIEDVPFYDYSTVKTTCMPANLGMVMRFYDNKTAPEELDKKFPEIGWSLDGFKQWARSEGFKIEDYESSVEDLKLRISEGRPIIVSQWMDKNHKWGEYGHVRVVVGYTDKYFITFDPIVEYGKNYNISFEDFKRLWNRGPEGCNRALIVYK
jgi:ABC-type bacteriocin/lantibiotic exporter with double-glycine peptidase domain